VRARLAAYSALNDEACADLTLFVQRIQILEQLLRHFLADQTGLYKHRRLINNERAPERMPI
jgi:hypothetical protein